MINLDSTLSYIWDISGNPVAVSIHADSIVGMFVYWAPLTGWTPIPVVPALPTILSRGQTESKECKEYPHRGHGPA